MRIYLRGRRPGLSVMVMRWFLLLIVSASAVWAQFPLPTPTRPISFPLAVPQRLKLDEGLTTTVVAWGRNDYGQTTVPADLADVVQVAAGFGSTLALKRDGTVVAWGLNDNGNGQTTMPAGLADVVQITVGMMHAVALKRDGTVVAWGRNDHGQTTVPAGLADVVQVEAGLGALHAVALKRDGTVVAWGFNNHGQTTVPADLADVVQVAAGDAHTVALKRDGTVVAWGWDGKFYGWDGVWDGYGQTTVPAGLVDVVQVAAGYGYTFALKRDGTVVAWGRNDHGQTTVPAGLADVVQVAVGMMHAVALKRDGTVVAWGFNNHGQTPVPAGLVDVVQAAVGDYHNVALKLTTIAKETPVISSWPSASPITYGQALSNSVLSGGSANTAGSFGWDTPGSVFNAGTNSAEVAFLPDSTNGYHTVSTNIPVLVLRAAPVVTSWPVASSITNGQTLSISVLSGGAADVAGSFGWTTPTTVPPVGTNSCSVTFTPANTDNYQTVSTNVPVVVAARCYTQNEYDSFGALQFSNGQRSVTTNPAAFSLYTESQFAANRIAGVADGKAEVTSNPTAYSLFTESSIMDMNLGGLMLKKRADANALDLELTIETKDNLTTDVWQVAERITRLVSMEGVQRQFLRVRADAPYVAPNVKMLAHPTLGNILTDGAGRVLYFFTSDTPGGNPIFSGSSWPYVSVPAAPKADASVTATIASSSFGRSNGPFLTINTRPAYTYAGDTTAGQATGHGAGWVWYTIKADGTINQ